MQPVEQRIHDNGFMIADADMTGSQYRLVKITGDAKVGICQANDGIYGILQNNPNVGQVANVRDLGISRVLVGVGGLTAGAFYKSDADGAAVPGAPASHAVGCCLIGAAEGGLASVTIGFATAPENL